MADELSSPPYDEPGTLTRAPRAIEPSKLDEALADLQGAKDEAAEAGFPMPSGAALSNAGRLLREMYAIWPRRFEVYPTPDGEIAIDAPGGRGRSVLLLCESGGGALRLVNMNGNYRSNPADAGSLPDVFLREALSELKRESE